MLLLKHKQKHFPTSHALTNLVVDAQLLNQRKARSAAPLKLTACRSVPQRRPVLKLGP